MILAAAIQQPEGVYIGRNHADIIRHCAGLPGAVKPIGGENSQGFWTDDRGFVDREFGARLAYTFGQTELHNRRLFSEDLYHCDNWPKPGTAVTLLPPPQEKEA